MNNSIEYEIDRLNILISVIIRGIIIISSSLPEATHLSYSKIQGTEKKISVIIITY